MKKSFQLQMKAKIAAVARAGFIRGRMIRQKIITGPQPSIVAASSRSRGSPRMNCTSRKMKKESTASSLGSSSGQKVFTQPSREKMMYCGTTVTCSGSMMLTSMTAKSGRLKENSSRAKA